MKIIEEMTVLLSRLAFLLILVCFCFISSGPVLVMVLEKENAVADWRALIGPTDSRRAKATYPDSIRAMCGLDLEKNCIHGSDSAQSALREISFFFKDISSNNIATAHDEL